MAPFEVLDSILTITFKTLTVENPHNDTKLNIKINLMDNGCQKENIHYKIQYSKKCRFGYYDLAENRMNVEYTNEPGPQTLFELNEHIYYFKCISEMYIKERVEMKASREKYLAINPYEMEGSQFDDNYVMGSNRAIL